MGNKPRLVTPFYNKYVYIWFYLILQTVTHCASGIVIFTIQRQKLGGTKVSNPIHKWIFGLLESPLPDSLIEWDGSRR